MEERKISKATYSKNRKADRIRQLQKELQMLAKQLKVAAEEEKHPLVSFNTPSGRRAPQYTLEDVASDLAEQRKQVEGAWIPKENSTKLEQCRSISLLSVERKIFFSVLARRMTDFLLKNKYIDTSVQKARMPGCLEHTAAVIQLIREAQEGNGDLAVLWLDLANAYGLIPHNLIETTLDQHHIPFKINDLILNYYRNCRLRVTSGCITSNCHWLEKRIITVCTISVMLYAQPS